MKKKLLWVCAIFAVLLVVTPIALYLLLPQLIQPFLEAKLASLGCENSKIKVQKISTHAADFEEMSCALPEVGSVSLNGIKISYSLSQLYRGNLASILVAKTSITVFPKNSEKKENATFTIPESFFTFVPITEIHFSEITVDDPLAGKMQGKLDVTFHALSAKGQIELNEVSRGNKLKTNFTLSSSELDMLVEEFQFQRDAFEISLVKNTQIKLKKMGTSLDLSVAGDLTASVPHGKRKHVLRLNQIKAELGTSELKTGFNLFYELDFPIPLEFTRGWSSGEIAFRLKAISIPLAKATPKAMNLLKFKSPLKIESGNLELAATGKVDMEKKIPLSILALTGRLQEVSGTYGELTFEKITYPIDAQLKGESFQLSPATFSVYLFNPGFPVKNIRGNLGMSAKSFAEGFNAQIEEGELEVFSGKAQIPGIKVNSKNLSSQFTAKLTGLSLADIVALQKQTEISASGVIDGSLPIELAKGVVLVRGGTLAGRSPGGHIAYRAGDGLKAAAAGNPGLKLAVDALENFQYQLFEGKLDYAANGNLDMALRIEGKNPDQPGARPIHFNFTVQENLPALLQSLRIAKDTESGLERLMQKK